MKYSLILWRNFREISLHNWWNSMFLQWGKPFTPQWRSFQILSSILWRHSQEIPLQNWWNSRWFCGEVPGELLYRIDEIVVDSVGKFPETFSIEFKIKLRKSFKTLFLNYIEKVPELFPTEFKIKLQSSMSNCILKYVGIPGTFYVEKSLEY